jgi:hypothetical protein
MTLYVPFISGILLAAGVQLTMGWWLDSGPGVVFALTGVFALALVLASDQRRALGLWAGVMVGMLGALVWAGPGTIWPIVMAMSAGLTAAAVAAGWAVRLTLRRS